MSKGSTVLRRNQNKPDGAKPRDRDPPKGAKKPPRKGRLNDPNDYDDPKWPYSRGKLDFSGLIIGLGFLFLVTSAIAFYWYSEKVRERVRTPLHAPKMIHPTATSAAEDPARFWGSYRTGVYFGMKTRTPRSPVFGLMWFTEFTGGMPEIRHTCEQGDRLLRFGWREHDGVNFGVHDVQEHKYTLRTAFVKRSGGEHGGDWTARVAVTPKPGHENVVVSLMFYMALDGQGHLEAELHNDRLDAILGFSEELGDFRLSFPKTLKNARMKSHYLSSYANNLSELKDVMLRGARMMNWQRGSNVPYIGLGGRVMPRDVQAEPNFMVHQVTVTLPFEAEIVFESGSFSDRPNTLAKAVFTEELSRHEHNFNTRFEDTFHLKEKGYSADDRQTAQSVLANMIGGIGYFYGQSLVQSPYNQEPLSYWPAPLYTGVPSRSFFPRGFLWDEGFHNLLISKWDPVISMDIIGHWLDLMNSDGWIPREQILGPEARAKVPSEFVVQRSENANPPTLFLPLQRLVKKLIKSEKPKDRIYLRHLYPRLKVWYDWFNTSQTGPVPYTYRWKGRDPNTKRELNPKTLSSGLDDSPRASHPTDDERHLDLRCWMALASAVMADIGKTIGQPWEEYEATYKTLTNNDILDSLHWSSEGQQYSDYGLHSNKVKLVRPKPPKNLQPGQRPPPDIPREMERFTKVPPKLQFVNSFGYISLFPFLLKIVDPYSLKLGSILQDLQNPNLLWTKYGLRSLAKTAPLYNKYNTEHDPPYWRGAIWININYLALDALHHYANTPGSYQNVAKNIYTELRKNLITNILSEYKRTGYIWENYDDNTGQGKGCHPFTGWSALFVLMMAEDY